MPVVKYRSQQPGLVPRRTRMEVPGWAGVSEPRRDGSMEHAWHCLPFTEAARAGIELCYPHPDELRVSRRDGKLEFEGDFGSGDERRPPFRNFGTEYFTYQLLLDLKVADGLALKTEPHPRFFTDTTGTAPIAVPAIIRHWWPMIYFAVFKAPREGEAHVFRPGEPFMQITLVSEEDAPELVPMSEEEAAERELQSRRIYESRSSLGADSQWTSATSTVFDGTYRRLLAAARGSRSGGG
ncbi:hypothetical protein [Lichenicoccus roseus]|uniref:Uncharacterized protein n=1 Tax=Lichenicoccus roseus TaxID=2683649 RepID=A0A5R9J9F2_9PROT|nr:hypothetical protein [Lichenicoccus roseus]TLU73177.1 hypothetical protein FE263_07050 [Lichenicoccus roseus]